MNRLISLALLFQLLMGSACFAQIKIMATNNNGFVQSGPGGPDNLVLFEYTPVYPMEGDTEDPPILPAQYFVIANLDSGEDLDGNGTEDTVGTFSGLEWSTENVGSGALVGCVRNDDLDIGNGEFYEIDPDTGETTLIGAAPQGLVVDLSANGSGYQPAPLPFGTPLIGGSGGGLSVAFNLDGNGFVVDLVVLSPGSGYEVGDIVRMPGAGQQDATFVISEIDGSDFDDLAFDPFSNRMYALRNIVDEDGNFGLNQLWVDSDNDLVPDSPVGGIIDLATLNQFATYIGGIHFDSAGTFYMYDAMEQNTWIGVPGAVEILSETDLESTLQPTGNGIVAIDTTLTIATSLPGQNTIISAMDLVDPMPPEDEPPFRHIAQVIFPQTFSQNMLFADVEIGDMIPAEADLDDLPSTFPDSVVINNGVPGNNAVLEALVVSDDFRYCVLSAPPSKTEAPIDISLVYTVPNHANLTLLGLEIEYQSNVPNTRSLVFVQNVNTQEFEFISTEAIPAGDDDTLTIDLSTSIDDYVNPQNGTMNVRIQSLSVGPVFFFPWATKYDSILVVSE